MGWQGSLKQRAERKLQFGHRGHRMSLGPRFSIPAACCSLRLTNSLQSPEQAHAACITAMQRIDRTQARAES